MQNDYVDISFTVKESELRGRKLVRDLKTGQIHMIGNLVEAPPKTVSDSEVEDHEVTTRGILEWQKSESIVSKSVAKRKKVQHGA